MKLENSKLDSIIGGSATISAAMIGGLVKLINSLLEPSRGVGSAIRRIHDGAMCPTEF